MSRQQYATIAAAVFFAAAVYDTVRIVVGPTWENFTMGATVAMGGTLALLWLVTAITLVLRRRAAPLVTWSWILSVFGVFGLVYRAISAVAFSTERLLGLAFFVAALAAGFCVKRSFDRGLFREGDHLDPRSV